MTRDNASRRSFLKGSALLAAPLVATAPAAALAADDPTRLKRLEDEAAIRALHGRWLRRVNDGPCDGGSSLFADPRCARLDEEVRGVAPDHSAEPERIELADDGATASARYPCLVELLTELPRDCTLGQMAHAQGCGYVRTTERRVLTVDYVKSANGWAIAKLAFTSA